MSRIPVAVLGATGVVGQRLVRRLARHPRFEVRALAASQASAGKRYRDACAWRLEGEAYGGFGDAVLVAAHPDACAAPVVLSALDTAPAREIEPLFAAAGSFVFSNASAFRMDADVPLLIPEVNAAHLDLLAAQQKARGWRGGIACNPNCTTTVLALALAPLHAAFGVEAVMMTSMQAVSGAGYPGVASLDILGNVVPFIAGEEDKIEAETRKLLGRIAGGGIDPAPVAVSAACHRVAVIDGHSESVSVRLRGSPSPRQVREALESFAPQADVARLPSAPKKMVIVHDELSRPQPRLDVEHDGGMPVHVGRIRECALLGIKMFLLGHNAERGAAGGALLNAELAAARGVVA